MHIDDCHLFIAYVAFSSFMPFFNAAVWEIMLVCYNPCPLHPVNSECIGQCSVNRKAIVF